MLGGDRGGERRTVFDIGDHHLRAFGGQRLGVVPPDTHRATGDDRGASVKSRHDPCS
jgi:hypothetical protein